MFSIGLFSMDGCSYAGLVRASHLLLSDGVTTTCTKHKNRNYGAVTDTHTNMSTTFLSDCRCESVGKQRCTCSMQGWFSTLPWVRTQMIQNTQAALITLHVLAISYFPCVRAHRTEPKSDLLPRQKSDGWYGLHTCCISTSYVMYLPFGHIWWWKFLISLDSYIEYFC